MHVLMINGSAHKEGSTFTALTEVGKALEAQGVSYEIFQLGGEAQRDCIGCNRCTEAGCVFEDNRVNEFLKRAEEADGFIFGSPVYYAHPSGRLLSFLDRAFYSGSRHFALKPGAAVVAARRGGCSASLDVINKYFTIATMPVVSSTYWNMVHGTNAEEVAMDLEGMQVMRNLGTNMAWMLKNIQAGQQQELATPVQENTHRTNFIRSR